MKKGLRIMLMILLTVIFAAILAGAYAWREIGASPTAEELAAFEKLPYFKNGEFQSPKKMVINFNNVRNGPANWSRFLVKSPFAPMQKLPQIRLTRESFEKQPENFAFYWLGHSSAIIELGGKRIIFDPVLGNAAPLPFAVPRYGSAPLKVSELPQIDYAVITHNHYDHLERKTVRALKNAHFIVPLGVGAALRGWGGDPDRITELGWNDVFEKDGLKIIAQTAVHFSGRGLADRNKTLWNSYILQTPEHNIYWAGDTGYSRHFADIGRQFGPFNLAVIEIDGWNTGWPNTHMFPREVITAARELQAEKLIPVHWAVFDLALHPWHESIDMVLEEASAANLKVLTPLMGEKLYLNSSTTRWWKD